MPATRTRRTWLQAPTAQISRQTTGSWLGFGSWAIFLNRLLTSLKFVECAHSKKNKQYGASKTCLIIAESCERRNGTPSWSRAGVSVRRYRTVRSGTRALSAKDRSLQLDAEKIDRVLREERKHSGKPEAKTRSQGSKREDSIAKIEPIHRRSHVFLLWDDLRIMLVIYRGIDSLDIGSNP